MIKVLLVDDHKLVRQGIRSLLENEPDIEVIGEAGNGPEALELLGNSRPDILVADLMMPGMTGIEVVKKGLTISPQTKCIILSMYGDDLWVLSALEAGAKGYVLKDSSSQDLAQAIRSAFKAQCFLSPPLSMEKILESKAKLSKNKA